MATSVEELTICVVCCDFLTDPQLLPCDHVFCKDCVNLMTDAGTITCPNCSNVCVIGDVKPDFELATFLDELMETTEKLSKLPKSSADIDDVTQKHVVPLSGDNNCDVCVENVIDSFCDQCQQWFCKVCRNAHSKMKATKYHTCTLLTEENKQQLKPSLAEVSKDLKEKTKELKTMSKIYESLIKELKAAREDVTQKTKALRKAFHEEIDKHFVTINSRIESFGTDQHPAMIAKMTACADMTTNLVSLLAKSHLELSDENKQLLSQAKELFKSLSSSSIDVLQLPQVRLERVQGLNLKRAVDLQFGRVRHKVDVCDFHVVFLIM